MLQICDIIVQLKRIEMKTTSLFLVLLFISFTTGAFAQEFTGVATYKTDMKMSITMDSTKTTSDQQSLINEQISLAMQKDYELTFTKSESNWKEIQELDKMSGPSSGIQIQMVGMGGGVDGLLYKNTKNKTRLETTDAFGKLFLVSGELTPFEWELTSETKQIGSYSCYKAIAKREVTEMHISEVNGEREEEEKTHTQTITAWYAPEIPVSHGPESYWGLPGLILEVSNGSRVMVCSKVVLNPEEKVAVEIPSKGKKVTSEQYEEIMEEQARKMNKMYGGGKKKGKNNSSFEIRIDG